MVNRSLSRGLGSIGVAAALLAGCSSASTTTTSTISTSSTTAVTTTSTPAPANVIWPYGASTMRFTDPVVAARSFAIEFLHMISPTIGSFTSAGPLDGTVEVQVPSSSAVTTIQEHRDPSGSTWWITGATTPNLVVTLPRPLDHVGSPLTVSGQSTAFEAVINLQVLQDGSLKAIGTGTAKGGSMGTMGPFTTSLSFPAPGSGGGALVIVTISPKDGTVAEATVVPLSFGP